MSAAEKFATALASLGTDVRDGHGQLVKGKLTSLVLQSSSEGWQAIAYFYGVEKWTVSDWTRDPVAALLDVVSRGPDMSAIAQPAAVADLFDLDDLLV